MAANTKTAPKKKAAAKRKAATKKKVTPKATPKKKQAVARKKAAASKAGGKRAASPGKKAVASKSANSYSDKSHWQRKRAGKPSNHPLMKTLRAEHRHLASVMELFAGQLDSVEDGELLDPHLVYEIIDYMVTWPDRFHHPREDLIYARVAELDRSAADEVDTLQRDHDKTAERGQGLLRNVERWRAGELSGEGFIERGREYIEHLYEHMNVEEKLVFPHIESVLTGEDWRELEVEDRLVAVAAPIFGPRVQREFRNVARKLRRGIRHSVERQTVSELIGIEAFMESIDALSMALESSRYTAGVHLRDAMKDAADIVKENPLTAPWRVAINNARVGRELLGDVANISRETLQDISQINQARKDRTELLDRNS